MRPVAALVALLVMAACRAGPSSSDEVAATPRSLAALVVQYLPVSPTSAVDRSTSRTVAAEVTFEPAGSIRVAVEAVDKARAELQRSICVNCDVTEPEKGTTVQVSRGDRLPGAGVGETGYVTVTRIRDDEIVTVVYEGTPIPVDGKADAGRLDLETLVRMVEDPGMGVTTVQGLVDAGDELDVWSR